MRIHAKTTPRNSFYVLSQHQNLPNFSGHPAQSLFYFPQNANYFKILASSIQLTDFSQTMP